MSLAPDTNRMSRHPRPVKRHPRSQTTEPKRHPRSPINETDYFSHVMQEMRPILLKEARKISRPYYIEPEDLVQEAMIKIFKNRNRYRSDLNTSLKTWIITIAKRQFYNIAITENRHKRVPQGMQLNKSFIDVDDVEDPTTTKTFCNCYYPLTCDTEYKIRYKEIICRTEIRLQSFEKEIFRALLEPPEALVKAIKDKTEKRLEEKLAGKSTKIPFQFIATADQLAEYFGVPKHRISQAKDSISDAMTRAFED